MQAPQRDNSKAREKLVLKAREATRNDAPLELPLRSIKQAPDVFQPRWEGLAYSPGRSKEHVSELAAVAGRDSPLDPVTVAAFGNDWYVLDGHHRLDAYRLAKWTRPVPVRVELSDLTGADRVEWAVKLSLSENVKSRLPMSKGDKADAAWRLAVAGGESKAEIAATANVSTSSVANMRKALNVLRGQGYDDDTLRGWRWTRAKREAHPDKWDLAGSGQDRRERELHKRLAPVMDYHPSADELIDAIGHFRPELVKAMQTVLQSGGWDEGDLGLP